jgi:hypothetical protein
MKIRLVEGLKLSNILLMILIDMAVNGFLVLEFELDSLAGAIAITLIFLLSIFLYFLIRELKRGAALYFVINIIMAPIILYLLILFSVIVTAKLKYEIKIFSIGTHRYELFINKIHGTYNISEIMDDNNDYFHRLLSGNFTKRKDITILLDSSNNMKICKDTLSGFPKANDIVLLKNE